MANGVATIKEVVSGDTVVLVGVPKGGPPPEKRLTLAGVIAPRVAMKSLSREVKDEAFGFLARDFMRRRLIGQSVEFRVVGSDTDGGGGATATGSSSRCSGSVDDSSGSSREFGFLKFKGENVACALLRRGLAKLRNTSHANFAKAFPAELQEMEGSQAFARQHGLGVWGNDAKTAAATVRDITYALNDADYVQSFVAANKHRKLPGIVEYVRDGGCVRVALFMEPHQLQQLEQVQKQEANAEFQQQLQEPLKVVYASVLLSGIQCDTFKRDQQQQLGGTTGSHKLVAEPFAAEALFFVEIRLLNREVDVRIEGCDEFGNVYGSLYHPRGNISFLLLQNGLARINGGTIGLTEAPSQLRLAMQEAQQKRLRIWKDWESSTENLEAKRFCAVVSEVLSGDALLLTLPDGVERRVYLSSVRCMRGAGPAAAANVSGAVLMRPSIIKGEESMAFQAKEFARKKLIGKQVQVCVDYVRDVSASNAIDGKHQQLQFVSVWLLDPVATVKDCNGSSESKSSTNGSSNAGVVAAEIGQNFAALLLQAGLAKTVPHRTDDERAKDYETYLELEASAQRRKIGLYAPEQQWDTFRIVDLSGLANVQRAHAHFQQLETISRIDGIVDHIYNACRYKVRIPSQNISISFALSGIKSPQPGPRGGGSAATLSASESGGNSGRARAAGGARSSSGPGSRLRGAEPFGDESLAYARSRLLQREVHIKVEAIDKGGNFLGTLWTTSAACSNPLVSAISTSVAKQQQANFAAELLELGFAHTVEFSLARSPHKELLLHAEQKAKDAKMRLWALPGAIVDDAASDGVVAGKEEEVDESYPEVIVSHVDTVDAFYIQEPNCERLREVLHTLAMYDAEPIDETTADAYTPGGLPHKGELVLGKYTVDNLWYRARVEGKDVGNSTNGRLGMHVFYVDFGNRETLILSRLRRCPVALRDIPPQAKLCCLAGVMPPPGLELEAAGFLDTLTQDRLFCCSVEKIDALRKRHVILTPLEDSCCGKTCVTVNEKLLRDGLGRLDKKSKTKIFNRLRLEEATARKAHVNVWRYGDCGADDEDEDLYSLSGNSRSKRRP